MLKQTFTKIFYRDSSSRYWSTRNVYRHVQWRTNCQVVRLGLGLAVDFVFSGYKFVCITSLIIVSLFWYLPASS